MSLSHGATLTRRHAAGIVRRFRRRSVLVVGDAILDRFIVGRVTRISPEAPVPVVRFESEHLRLGGAANVAHNIVALGGRASLVAVVGPDDAGSRLRTELKRVGVDRSGLVTVKNRPTTEKLRIVTERNQQVARIDYEDDVDVDRAVEQAIVRRTRTAARGAAALLVSDYLKGVVTRRVIEELLAIGNARVSNGRKSAGIRAPLIVDPKIPHLTHYEGATLITPNHHEAEAATRRRIRDDGDAGDAARDFRKQAKCAAVLITRGEHGMWLSADGVDVGIPAMTREVADVTGAGDTVVATLALALAAGATTVEAAILANHAAGVVVGKFGPATVSPRELLETF
ncbi:MAG TPA: PfkB family carbohydrate kinase [Vicinamibacterales bacterium]|jgi:D-beta-D-heptose 7-phosphate kinase/D-beta-D-heptose 1-phosphate adenosyltransferase